MIQCACDLMMAVLAVAGGQTMDHFSLWASRKAEVSMMEQGTGVCIVRNSGKGGWALSGMPVMSVTPGERYAFSCTVESVPGESPMAAVLGVVIEDPTGKVLNYTHGWKAVKAGESGKSEFTIPEDVVKMRPQLCGQGPGAIRVSNVLIVPLDAAPAAARKALPKGRNPLEFPSSVQTIVAEFATDAEAESAMAEATPLPDGATVAYSARWDDSNPAHVQKGEMLRRVGWKGTFFLCGDVAYMQKTAPLLLAQGHAVGNHTTSHPFMMEIGANRVFSEIMEQKIALETNTGFPVVSYVSPYGWGASINADRPPLVAQLLLASGEYVTSDSPVPAARVPASEWMPTRHFGADDRKPNKGMFDRGIAAALRSARGSDEVPHVTLGTHSWCDAKGTEEQGRWLTAHRGDPDGFYGNDNEYGAYRYSYLNGSVEKTGTNGRFATFRVVRFDPAFLGDRIPLTLRFSCDPKAAHAGSEMLVKTAKGNWLLPHDAVRKLPGLIVLAGEDGTVPELPGISLRIAPDEAQGRMKVVLANKTGRRLTEATLVVCLPPKWTAHRKVCALKPVESGQEAACDIAFGPRSARPDYAEGAALYAVSADFDLGGAQVRVYAKKTQASQEDGAAVGGTPRDTAWVMGPFAGGLFKEGDWIAASVSGAELKNVGEAVNEKWMRLVDPSRTGASVYSYMPYGKLKNEAYVKAIGPVVASKDAPRLVVAEFESSEAGEAVFFCSALSWEKPALYLNGEKVALTGVKTNIRTKAGRNRLVLRTNMTQCATPCSILLHVCKDDLAHPLKFLPISFQ